MMRLKVTTLAIVAALVVALLGVDRLAVGLEADPVFVGAGDIASCASSGDEATANLLDGIPGTVYTLGDNAYESGTDAEFASCYNSSWGRHKARTKPSVGNHEYLTAGASGYYKYFGAAAGESSKGYYSYDLGAWHIIALNSMCEKVGGCGATSTMVSWLKGDLATHPSSCTLAYWHHPVFSSGSTHGNDPKMIPSWDALYAAGADVVLSGHDHDYERFAPQTSSGVGDPARGIREFVVGTGGRSHYGFGTIRANSEVRNSDTNGVLKLTLHASSYEWQFVPEAGKIFSDSGSGSCHSAPPSTTDRPGPPSVTTTDPGANAPGVATTTNVTAFFSEEMMASSINGKTFKLFKKGSSTKIGAGVTYFPDDRSTATFDPRATLDPNSPLRSGVTYKAVVTTGAMDSVGNPLPQQYKWFFTVR
jgi:Bacterial Ig-like domain/Calcineurin-like phosphoesterase